MNMGFSEGMITGAAKCKEAIRRGDPLKVFDWDKAAALIAEHKVDGAEAGLAGDWDYTGGAIFSDGQPVTDEYTYLSSMWAMPTLRFDDGREFECFTTERDDWDADTKWPSSALDILAASRAAALKGDK